MGNNFFQDPFGGSFAGRVYTKVAKAAAGDTSYSVLNPEKNNKTRIGQSLSSNDKFTAFRNDGDDTQSAEWKRKFSDGEQSDNKQSTQQPSTWQKIKSKVSDWWNGNNNSTSVDKVCNSSATIDNTNSIDSPDYIPVSTRSSNNNSNVGQ